MRLHALIGGRRIEVLAPHSPNRPRDIAITRVRDTGQGSGHLLQERVPIPHRERTSGLEESGELGVGKRDRRHGGGAPRRVIPGIRDLASLSKTLARNRKSCTGVAATKGLSPRLRRQACMLWRDLRAAIKTEMAARRQVMKQSDRAKRSERAVALVVERIKSTTSYGSARRHNG
jgi:hypothetical protein